MFGRVSGICPRQTRCPYDGHNEGTQLEASIKAGCTSLVQTDYGASPTFIKTDLEKETVSKRLMQLLAQVTESI